MLNTITKIEETSPLYKKAAVGERLLSINGQGIEDVLDYKYYSYDQRLVLELESADGRTRRLKVKKQEGEPLGLEFESYLMDSARGCSNHCLFCFVDQLPKGLRKTLYFKDDDARLSFLTGNYITLTNLTEREIERICALRVSPLNISVHTTDPELRVRMLKNPAAANIMPLLRRFAQAGITMDCQIVCCPGINDGAALQSSLEELAGLYPQVNSVSIVPVGLTRHREHLEKLKPFDEQSAKAAIALVQRFAQDCMEKYGSSIFWCSDEMYLKARVELPDYEYYEDFSQLENGVGLMRLLEEEFCSALESEEREPSFAPFAIATGVSAAGFMEKLVNMAKTRFPQLNGKVYAIENDFFGHTIDVAGLITGGDLIAQLRGRELGKRLLVPGVMLRHGEGVFLDDVTLRQVEAELGVPVCPVENDGEALLRAMLQN